jgi:hypothetical protein
MSPYYAGLLIHAAAGTANAPRRTLNAFELKRGSPNWQAAMYFWYPGASSTYVDVDDGTYLTRIEAGWTAMGTLNGHQYNGPATFAAPNEASLGSIDSVFFYWNRSAPTLEISDIHVTKID